MNTRTTKQNKFFYFINRKNSIIRAANQGNPFITEKIKRKNNN